MIVAGEASGDLHGGDLAREISRAIRRASYSELRARKCARRRPRDRQMEDIHGLGLSELASTDWADGRRVSAPAPNHPAREAGPTDSD